MTKAILRLMLAFVVLGQPLMLGAQEASQDPIRSGYERLYQGDVNGAYGHFRALAEREPQNLAAAFGYLMALYERGLQDATLQKEFEQRIDQLIQTATTRYEKNKQDGESLFYLTQAYLHRSRYRFGHDKGVWGAARDGVKAKNYGEQYVKLNPNRADAYLALGLYNYYVGIAPTFFKFLRVLLFMPKGNRTEGLKQIERAARDGEMWAPFAQSILIEIYGSYEDRFEDAVRLAEALQRKYPENPEYRFDVARLYSSLQVEDYERAAQQYTTIIQRVEQKHPNYKLENRYSAVLNLARMRQQQWRLEDAIAMLTPTIDAGVAQPEWVLPNFLLTRSNYRALLGDPRAADDARRILAEQKWKNRHEAAQQRIKWIEQRQQSGEAAVYAELIPGNRLVAEHRWDEARRAYEPVRQRRPDDWQVRYRLAYLEFARGDDHQAEAGFSQIVNSNPGRMPDWIKANAMLHLARIYDIRGQRDQAVKLYKKIVDDYEKEGAAQNARRGLITAYRRPATTATAGR